MNGTIDQVYNLISTIKKSTLLVATFFSLFTSGTSTPSGKISDLIPESTKEVAQQNTDKIIGTLNQNTYSTSNDEAVKILNKLNQLNLTAPNYSILKINNKNTQSTQIPDNQKQGETKNISNATSKQPSINQTTPLGSVNLASPAAGASSSSNIPNNLNLQDKISIANHNPQSSDDSIVNIRCESKAGTALKVITGSGVLISSTGAILTAAHVAAPVYSQQSGGNYNCYARINNPAAGKFPVRVAFIDRSWVNKYYSVFDQAHNETGENDIAVLQIDNSNSKITNSDLLSLNSLNYANLSLSMLNINDSISIKSYPADDYGKYGVFMILPRKSESNSIEGLLNFNANGSSPIDLIETGSSSLGQSGASGGGVFNGQGQLIGIISNTVPSDILLKNKIRALSTQYISNEIQSVSGKSIFQIISGSGN